MCQNTPKAPIVIVTGVVIVIILVVVLGISLTNSLNLSNIIRLNEKVASDSANSHSSAEMSEASLVQNHPRNLHKFQMINDDGGRRSSSNSSSEELGEIFDEDSSRNETMFSHKTDNRIMIDEESDVLQKRNHIKKVI